MVTATEASAYRRVGIDGYDVDVRTYGRSSAGSASGPHFVLIHGIGASSRYFKRLTAELAADSVVHTVDMPGFAATRRPDRQLEMADFARITREALTAAGVQTPAVLVGHSMGCQVAVEMALQEPGAAKGLVLLGPTINNDERSAPMQALRLFQDTFREPLAANAIVFSDYARAGMRWYLRTLPVMIRHRMEERISGVEVPTVLVRGGRDPIVPADWLERLRTACPSARTAEVPGQGHVVMYSRPAETAVYCRELAQTP